MISNIIKQLGIVKFSAIIGGILVMLVGIAVLSMHLTSPSMVPLYTNLSLEDSGEITQQLESMKIPYELKANGTQIFVPESAVLKARMSLAQQGMPSSGNVVGYELFDHSDGLGVSSFLQDVNMKRALEGELARTIASFSKIDKARVHLVLPEKEVFSKEKKEPTASIVINLKGADGLENSEISAISHLVATAVPGLKPDKITIVDTKGRPFKLGASNENDPGYFASTTEQHKVAFEKRMEHQVEQILEKIVGQDRVTVQISADMDFDRIVTNSETYDPDGRVPRSIQTIEETERNADKDTSQEVSVNTNLPNDNSQSSSIIKENSTQRLDETTNFEISKTIQNHVKETGTIKHLSIAVLVDGTYKLDENTDETVYTPRSEEYLEDLKRLTMSAVGFNAARGDTIEVINQPFSRGNTGPEPERPYDWLKRELSSILQTLIIGVVVVFVIVLVIRPMMNRAFEITKTEAEEAALANAFAGIDPMAELTHELEIPEEEEESMLDMDKLETRIKVSTIKNINTLVETHPQEALNTLRNWLYQSGGDQ